MVSYSIVAGNTYDAFTIRNFTGEIRVNNELDYENITSYSLDVRAWDGQFEDYCKVIINIENLNDNPPIFLDNYTKTIEEEKLYDGCIVKVILKSCDRHLNGSLDSAKPTQELSKNCNLIFYSCSA